METKQNIIQKSRDEAFLVIEEDMQRILSNFMLNFAAVMQRTDTAILDVVIRRVEDQFRRERSKNAARSRVNATRSKKGPTKRRV